MRYYTYGVGAALVIELEVAGAVEKIIHDGRDIIHLQLVTGHSLMIHLIDSSIPLYEIRNILTDNTRQGYHTLFMLWCDMLIPNEGAKVELEDWHQGLLAAFGGKIYTYRIYMQELLMFPVYFDPIPYTRFHYVRYGETIDIGSIQCETQQTQVDGLTGTWRVASFNGDPNAYYRQRGDQTQLPPQATLQEYYLALQIEPGTEAEAIKQAYRQLARRYHPDLNPNSGSTEQMQKINRAYQTIMQSLKDDTDKGSR